MKKSFFLLVLLISVVINAQVQSENIHLKSFIVKNDTIKIDTISISSANFKVFTNQNIEIDPKNYSVNFSKSLLIFKKERFKKFSEVIVQYTSFPKFLTKNYFKFNKKIIVPKATSQAQLYSLTTNQQKIVVKPFEGLNTMGNITRGVTIGNNQNAVVNSTLDLQIAGKLSDKVTLKAKIIDTNLPIQENGNTYKLNEFDRVFIKLFSDTWSIDAGDIYLNNNETSYLRFNKQVSGLAINTNIKNNNSEINIQTTGAIVRGKYKKVQFNGREGNQGPYRLSDLNNNSYILILIGTEKIYANGKLLKRGENKDYTIDYNTAEVTFSTTFPMSADVRITAEYQFSDRAYTRFTTYNNVAYKTKKLTVNGYFYNENDLKNQSLEQDLSNEQKQLLANAGSNTNQMVTPSAFITPFSEDKILYKKISIGASEIFEFSTDETEELYQVTFTYVGENLGNYILKDFIAIGKIFEYVGENLGNYNPIIRLTAPNKLQLTVFKASYNPYKKTTINAETAFSNNDINLFSTLDNATNKGIATKLGWKQLIFEKKWNLKSNFKFEFIDKQFKSIERIQKIEFNRDWNIETNTGSQKLLSTTLELSNKKNKIINYKFENLELSDYFKGNKHNLNGNFTTKNFNLDFNSSLLNNETITEKASFLRYYLNARYNLTKSWFGVNFNSENNKRTNILDNTIQNLSHKYQEFKTFMGVGDSTKVFVQIGANFRTTDSIQNNKFAQVNTSETYYLKSNLINSISANLTTYINYRSVKNTNFKNEESLNSKIAYKQQLFNQFLTFNTIYQTLSGTLPQQDFTYIKTEQGQGFYTWIDYNENGIKELDEFEIAQFTDQAQYLRIILPTVNYIATHQNKFTQTIAINPQQWNSKKGLKKLISHFYNHTFILIDGEQQKLAKKFNLNPFDIHNKNLLGLNFNLNNSVYFNKGKKKFSTTYRFIKSQNKLTTTIDNTENKTQIHKLQFEHKFDDFWLFNFNISSSENKTNSANFTNRNYFLKNNTLFPKLSYYYSKKSFFSAFYENKNKENKLGGLETLKLQKIGFLLNYVKSLKSILKIEINFLKNTFKGANNSPVAYQMLEGFQPGKNYTWSFLFQHKLNSFLNLNINYLGRKSETSRTVHTGAIQLKAIF
ncbi:hypothetical protein Lupro_09770 [Lutibacter profundi]|uniref:Outer membrane protein beta-barrel domain-containing protein n=1 Tax=Lutibacter profundi TaxID=1622118 RepID=A0A0X8G7K0_9FLAO|nr:hypothetical protein [Lutibacter profundi]AMC11536.1 hypothetical protein Lupro_09770 [Lutibacter profundi]